MASTVEPVLTRGRLSGTAQPVLRVDHLVLRPWDAADTPVVAAAYADPAISHWHRQAMTVRAEAASWVAAREQAWAAETGADWAVVDGDTVQGRVALHDIDLTEGSAEVGYWVLPAARGRHLTARALGALAGWAFTEGGFHRLELSHAVANTASCRAATGAGFVHEGTRRAQALHPDGWHDTHLHARLATDPG